MARFVCLIACIGAVPATGARVATAHALAHSVACLDSRAEQAVGGASRANRKIASLGALVTRVVALTATAAQTAVRLAIKSVKSIEFELEMMPGIAGPVQHHTATAGTPAILASTGDECQVGTPTR